ncbi:MAG TPA: glycosyltransferase family 2 protein [Saprospiraceae bacterium]|nr:glycosyltransferase family 2 protein [Saprospiraceae bacterium]
MKVLDVIIPAYNCRATLPRALASIMTQVLASQIQVIVVDDKSDETYEDIIDSFKPYLDIQLIHLSENVGPGGARQAGLDAATDEWVTFMDADDTFSHPFTLNSLLNNLVLKQMDVGVGEFAEELSDGRLVRHEHNFTWMFGKIYRRAFLEQYQIRFNNTRANEDAGFNTIVSCCTDKIYFHNDIVYNWHYKATSITRINDHAYTYDKGLEGYFYNMKWAMLEALKKNIPEEIGDFQRKITERMFIMYFYYVNMGAQHPEMLVKYWEWIRPYYLEVYKPYQDKITPEKFKIGYQSAIHSVGEQVSNAEPYKLTFYSFLDLLNKETFQEGDK